MKKNKETPEEKQIKTENNETIENTPTELEKLAEEVNDYKDKYLRAVAETDNLRKRFEREKRQIIQFANEKLAKDILETVDNFENAMNTDMPEDIKMGINLVYKNLLKTLTKHGISEVEYDNFNPKFHEAISAGGDNIKTIHRKGYMIGERLLRPAMVGLGD